MKFENLIVVSDIDGTFLGRGASLIDKNVEAVKYFNSLGGKFTFATGRVHYNVLKAVRDANLLCTMPVITVNGACIYDLTTDRTVYEKTMSASDAVELTEFVNLKYPHIGVRCSTDYGMLTNCAEGIIKKDIDSFEGGLVEVKNTDKWTDDKVYKMVFRAQEEELINLRDELEHCFAGRFTVSASSPRYLELNAKGCSKADGIVFLKKFYMKTCKVNPIVFAVGDYENDLQMLKAADYSACPENASDIIKSVSDFVLCDCDDGAVGELIKLIVKL